jgi:O-antigen/teichoic acid export membrane protein
MLKKLVHSAGAVATGQILNIIANIALVPVYILTWSSSVYGEWIALSSLIAYLETLNIGMNAAAGNSLVAAYARQDWAKYKALQGSALMFYVVLASAICVIAGAVCLLWPISPLLGIVHISPSAGALIIWILAARLMWQMPASQLWNTFRSTGQFPKSQWLWNLQFLGSLVATGVVLLLHGGPVQVAIWASLPFIATAVLAWVMIRKEHPQLLPDLHQANRKDLWMLLGPSSLFGVVTLALAIALNGPVVLVSRALGGTAVALLVTTRTMTTSLRQISQILTTAVWPEITRFYALSEFSRIQQLQRVLTAVVVSICGGLAGMMWFEGDRIIYVWTRGRLVCDDGLLHWFIIAAVLNAPWIASSVIPMATNRHKILAKSYLVSSILGVGLTWALLPRLGLKAVPIGVILGEGAACYHSVIKNACGLARQRYGTYALRLWGAVIVATSSAGVAAWSMHRITFPFSPIAWVASFLAAATASALTAGIFFLSRDDRRRVHSAIYRRIHTALAGA